MANKGKGQSKHKKQEKFQREHPEGRKEFAKAKRQKRLPIYLAKRKRKSRDPVKLREAKIERRIKRKLQKKTKNKIYETK